MTAAHYRAVIAWFNAHPHSKAVLRIAGIGAVAAVYILYFGMLAWLVCLCSAQLLPAVVVPAAAFLLGTFLRAAINRPRPYTALGFEPLFPKSKAGQSMPSRHCFSAAAIAGTAWFIFPPLGIALTILSVWIAAERVLTGVHYISDVVVGLAFGACFSVIGWMAVVTAVSAAGFYPVMFLL